jgi:hypothetical protein
MGARLCFSGQRVKSLLFSRPILEATFWVRLLSKVFSIRSSYRTLLFSLALAPLVLTNAVRAQMQGFRPLAVPLVTHAKIQLYAFHDEDLMVYINGVLAAKASGYTGAYEILEMRPEARAQLKPGATITPFVSCHQTNGGQYVDVGFAHENVAVR